MRGGNFRLKLIPRHSFCYIKRVHPRASSLVPIGERLVAAKINNIHFLVCLMAVGLWGPPAGADGLREEKDVELKRLALVGGGVSVFRYLGFRYMDRAWYQGEKLGHFRWINDWGGETYLNMDKGGHFMGGLALAQTFAEAYAWCGLGGRSAALLGTLSSWAALLEIEMRDAQFDQWGFSIPDFFANSLGAGVPLLHTYFPATRDLRFKFSYYPSALYLDRDERRAADRPHVEHLIDDYQGMTFWMTLALNQLLRGRAEEIWPDFLGLGLGYGVTGLHGSNVKSKGPDKYYGNLPAARPEIFIALDYDARFLPGRGRIWNHIKTRLNLIHFPAPALRIYPKWRIYLLY